jgi:hypothetical protein
MNDTTYRVQGEEIKLYLFQCVVGYFTMLTVKKIKTIPVTGHGGPSGCERSELPHFLDNRLTDGGEIMSLMRRLPLPPTPGKIPGTHFC